MYSDVKVAENVDEHFLSALALLHSSDVDSADKLRKMLDLTIEKKSVKTPARTLTKEKKRQEFTPYYRKSKVAARILSEFEDQLKLMNNESQREDYDDRVTSISSNVYNYPIGDHASRSSSEICSTDVEDSPEGEEIPRISIPDETTGDGIVCKVCNGDKLGPLILLECQECQEAYHPLCHQPPVVDIDVYDPRIVWRCRKCIDMSDAVTSAASFVVTLDNDGMDVCRDGNRQISSKSIGSQASTLAREKLRKREENSPKKTSRTSLKNAFNPRASSHLRKRVGSKLSVTRASFANSCSVQQLK